jgi:hypothetical protein
MAEKPEPMKLEELYNLVMSDRDRMAEFVKAAGTGTLSAFAARHGCSAADAEIRDFFLRQCEGELSDDAVEAAAGGAPNFERLVAALFDDEEGRWPR